MKPSASGGARLDVDGLRLTYPAPSGTRQIFDIDRFSVAAGEMAAICGPSGSGKSSLLNLVSGIAMPDTGRILWDGLDLASLPARARDRWRREHLGIVFQQFHLFPKLAPLDNVLIAARFDRWRIAPALREHGRALLERLGVPDSGATERLSRGEMQRVALARALVLAPRVLIADEPTASLDAASADGVMDLMIALCREHRITALVATHDLRLARRLDSIRTLDHGQLVESRA